MSINDLRIYPCKKHLHGTYGVKSLHAYLTYKKPRNLSTGRIRREKIRIRKKVLGIRNNNRDNSGTCTSGTPQVSRRACSTPRRRSRAAAGEGRVSWDGSCCSQRAATASSVIL